MIRLTNSFQNKEKSLKFEIFYIQGSFIASSSLNVYYLFKIKLLNCFQQFVKDRKANKSNNIKGLLIASLKTRKMH